MMVKKHNTTICFGLVVSQLRLKNSDSTICEASPFPANRSRLPSSSEQLFSLQLLRIVSQVTFVRKILNKHKLKMSSFINQTSLSKENSTSHTGLKRVSVKRASSNGISKVRRPLGQINSNVAAAIDSTQSLAAKLDSSMSKMKHTQQMRKAKRKPLGTISTSAANVNNNIQNVEAWPKTSSKSVEYFPYTQKPSAKTFLGNLSHYSNRSGGTAPLDIDREETKHLISSGFDAEVSTLAREGSHLHGEQESSNKKNGLLGSLIGDMGDEELSDLSSSDESNDNV